jgi:hypothetical protein
MSDTYNIVKGTRIRARWFDAKLVSLSGVMPKVEATMREVTGTVRHIRGDHPTHPTVTRLYVEADDGLGDACGKCQVREVEVDPKHVVEILSK